VLVYLEFPKLWYRPSLSTSHVSEGPLRCLHPMRFRTLSKASHGMHLLSCMRRIAMARPFHAFCLQTTSSEHPKLPVKFKSALSCVLISMYREVVDLCCYKLRRLGTTCKRATKKHYFFISTLRWHFPDVQMPRGYVFFHRACALAAVASSRPVCPQWRFHAIHAGVALARMPLRAALRKMGPRAKIAKPLLRGVVFDLDGTLTDSWIWPEADGLFETY